MMETARILGSHGIWVDHLTTDKWSFRIKVNGGCVWGMQEFNIQRPESRYGIGEYLIHTMYNEAGGVSLYYDFVDVVINGEYMGVYAVEESFDKTVPEGAQRREGPILDGGASLDPVVFCLAVMRRVVS